MMTQAIFLMKKAVGAMILFSPFTWQYGTFAGLWLRERLPGDHDSFKEEIVMMFPPWWESCMLQVKLVDLVSRVYLLFPGK